jgi:hypothetical protein
VPRVAIPIDASAHVPKYGQMMLRRESPNPIEKHVEIRTAFEKRRIAVEDAFPKKMKPRSVGAKARPEIASFSISRAKDRFNPIIDANRIAIHRSPGMK